jgi:Zn-dependent protease
VSSTPSTDDRPTTSNEGIRVGQVGAVPIFLRPSWFAIAAIVTLLYAPTVRNTVLLDPGLEYLIGFGFAILLLLSVFVHELAHAAAASVTGTPASHIVLDLWGGHTAFSEESSGPWRSILVSVVGPLSNAVLALAAELALRAFDPAGVTRLLLVATATSNLVVAAFNALPGLPLDGGRVLEALVWRISGDRHRGTLVAGWSGRALAVGTAAWTVLLVVGGHSLIGSIWLLAVAWLLWHGAGQAIAAARWFRQAGRAQIDQLLRPAVAVASTATVATALLAATQAGFGLGVRGGEDRVIVVLDVYGRPAAVVDERALAGVPSGRADQVGAAAVAHPLPEGAVLTTGLSGDDLIGRLQARPASRYAVLDRQDQVVGVLEWEDVARFVAQS